MAISADKTESAGKGPAQDVKSCLQRGSAQSTLFGPIGQAFGFPTELNHSVGPHVAGLFLSGSPAAIIRGIWAVVIYALDRVGIARTESHILDEIIETRSPPIADDDAPVSIVMRGFGVSMAPANHRIPYCVLSGMSEAMRAHACSRFFRAVTSAAIRVNAKAIVVNKFLPTACTLAQDLVAGVGSGGHCKTSEHCSDWGAWHCRFHSRAVI